MNFLKALQHAFIGYGIRRKSWKEDMTLCWYEDQLRWMNKDTDPTQKYDPSAHNLVYDWDANDWEVI